jgi:hypothetical protein
MKLNVAKSLTVNFMFQSLRNILRKTKQYLSIRLESIWMHDMDEEERHKNSKRKTER